MRAILLEQIKTENGEILGYSWGTIIFRESGGKTYKAVLWTHYGEVMEHKLWQGAPFTTEGGGLGHRFFDTL
jgi:hypothetical protein